MYFGTQMSSLELRVRSCAYATHPRNQTSWYILLVVGTADSEWVDQFQRIGSEGGQDFQVVREF